MAILSQMAADMQATQTELGFEKHQLTLPSGETVGYLEKPAMVPTGGSAKPPLVCLHGLTDSSGGLLRSLGPPLQLPDDVRCLVPDLLGHGTRIAHAKASERGPGWSWSEYAADVDAFMIAAGVAPAEKVTLAGYSLGGGIVQKYAELFGPAKFDKAVLLGAASIATWETIQAVSAGNVNYAYDDAEGGIAMVRLIGGGPELAAGVGPVLALGRKLQHGEEESISVKDYWQRMWMSLMPPNDGPVWPTKASDLELANIPEDLPVFAGAKALAAGGVPTLVVASANDAVCDINGARAIERAFGTTGLCSFVSSDEHGHFFHPTSLETNLVMAGGKATAKFLGHC